MIGGAPVTQEFANSIGADAFAADAPSAARIARQLLA
jgi:methanogenic corrinoid protein MtbC1